MLRHFDKNKKSNSMSIVAEDGTYYLYTGNDVICATRKSEVAQAWIEKYDINRMIFN